ncbi:MAG TPA: hypothetical protein DHU59_02460 [Clostridiales bacterium]|nr:hypothetical protein [Clostridiales bacterium]
MSKIIFKREDIKPFLEGLTIYGTGGGGEPEWGKVILENDLDRGRVYEIVNPEDIEDDAFICSGGIMGSVKSLDDLSFVDTTLGWEKDFPLVNAIRTMEKIKGRKVDYLIPFEVGALNTPVIMSAAARLGIPMINGDACGRSCPETQMASFIGHGIDLYPMPLLDSYGNTTIVMKGNTPTYADEVGRFIVVKGGGFGANAHYPMSGAELKRSCVPYTVTRAIEFGKVIENANIKGENPVEAFRKTVDGKLLFEGVISHLEGEDRGGFYLTNLTMDGKGQFYGKKLKMVVKNESMAVWIDDKLAIMFPDCAFMLDTETGYGIPSIDHKVGLAMSIVCTPCHERIRECMETEIGKIAYGAARYGYSELEYIPFENL